MNFLSEVFPELDRKSEMSNFSPRENRSLKISRRKYGREILPLKSPFEREKRYSPFKISLGEIEGRIIFQNHPWEERKYFLGRIQNLPSKFKIEINVIWPLVIGRSLYSIYLTSIWSILYDWFIQLSISDGYGTYNYQGWKYIWTKIRAWKFKSSFFLGFKFWNHT